MVFKCRRTLCIGVKFLFAPPLLVGFTIGVLSVYMHWLLFDCNRKPSPATTAQDSAGTTGVDDRHHRYYHVDLSKPGPDANVTLLCLVFITDIDSLLMQHNVWLKKCGDNRVYVGERKHKYIGHVVTETYSPHAWKYNCQTLMYLHAKYNSGTPKYDWIFLAKDNVWLIYENLLHLISLLNVDKHHDFYAGQYTDGVLSTNAGLLLSTDTLTDLARLLDNLNACDTNIHNSEHQMLDYYLKQLNNTAPVGNADVYGCTLFHSINLYGAFNASSLKPRPRNKCISDFAITFQLDLTSKYYAMFYKYVLYKVRLVTEKDLMPNAERILPLPSPGDDNIWQIEAMYELNQDPSNMSQSDFFYYWSKKRQIIL